MELSDGEKKAYINPDAEADAALARVLRTYEPYSYMRDPDPKPAFIPPELSYEHQFELVKIAAETPHPEVREIAVMVLRQALNPMMMVKEQSDAI